MKRILFLFIFTLHFLPWAHALDPYAPKSDRDKGMLRVITPQGASDVVTVTRHGGAPLSLPPNTIQWVPIGNYHVLVKMQGYQFQTKVSVQPTELTDATVTGFGNVEVQAPPGSTVEATQRLSGNLISFPANQIKTIPKGYYNFKINVGKTIATENDVLIFDNTTRKLIVTLQGEENSHAKKKHP